MRRRFNSAEREALYLAADGKCESCGVELEPSWHADHIRPFARNGQTDITNGAALCPTCNERKGATMAQNVHTPRVWHWVGVDRSELIAVLRVRGEDALAAAVLAEGIEPAAEHGGARQKQGSATTLAQTRDSTFVVARLKRDDPALAQQVIAGEITANAAAIASGIRKPYARHRTDDANRAIQSLLRHYTREQLLTALEGAQ